ncbi:MAG: tRNA (N6-isopentenyl adenosine(37)-C2)-methylthiotransferase MiaB [Candidatus Margulisbacteria bacterium]|nr:tRNA (N6-isopentenyl adenosine(37)-C2)-methylthiotransferase MiaB [Candidatus Margulisiibacteriota bacterium]
MISGTFYIFTYGCQMNKNDSELMAGILTEECLLQQTDKADQADYLIFNSCAVRENAETRVFGRIREFAGRRKKQKSSQKIILAGCIPQYEKNNIFKKHPYIDYIVGVNSIEFLPQLLSSNTERISLSVNKDTNFVFKNILRDSRKQAWIPIMFGCDNFCSYCIVPYTRGREKSRKKEDIFKEIESLHSSKYTEIFLLGQNVNSYGKNLYMDYDFTDLLTDIHKYSHISKIDFLTSHPKDISEKLIRIIAKSPKINKEIHFPLQAGDNEILKKMNRGYSYEQYKNLVLLIKKIIPDVKISTDLIVGFPGETEKQFQNTVKAVQELGFYRVNTAAFSPRKGTKAAEMDKQIDEKTRHTRLLLLQKAVDEYAFSKNTG